MFACAGCGAVLTVPVSRVALPVHAEQKYGHDLLGPLMEPGTYAMNPEGGAVVIAPGDVRGTVFIPGRSEGYCCGFDGRDGPNLACERCGQEVATRIDDCSYWQAVWLHPPAVHRLAGDDDPQPVTSWEALPAQRPVLPPIDPDGWWNPIWAAAVAAALAHLLAESDGTPVTVPDGPVADVFRRSIEMLLPPGTPAMSLAVAGPGLPVVSADLVLVPQHPQNGEHWPAPPAVPLAYDVWRYLAFHRERRPVPGAGAMPDEARRDDPPPRQPAGPFRPDWGVFVATLARLPEIRRPWLGELHDRVRSRPYLDPF
ncbi:hypothetical protein ACQP2Y_12180 [Actinoplanes sp. CA-051413]|uniref:hypothetical protein n=1 Tax=Actinoplanes sp. CA-051413 TaxID=3239899 RepID=UPI003D985C80